MPRAETTIVAPTRGRIEMRMVAVRLLPPNIVTVPKMTPKEVA
jgi:hypothetical protein